MATSYQDIIDAIDAAVLSHAAYPVSISAPDGRNLTFPSYESMLAAREYYTKLVQQATGRNFNLRQFISR